MLGFDALGKLAIGQATASSGISPILVASTGKFTLTGEAVWLLAPFTTLSVVVTGNNATLTRDNNQWIVIAPPSTVWTPE